MNQSTGWPNRDGEDVNFIRALLAKMRLTTVSITPGVLHGMEFGGIMTNRLGCELKDELRAIAPVMGQGQRSGVSWIVGRCARQLIVWMVKWLFC